MIVFECPTCKKKLQAAEQHAGKAIKCPHCQAVAKVPVPMEEVSTALMETEAAPAPPAPTAVTTPEVAESTKSRRDRDDEEDGKRGRKRDDDDDDGDDRPRKRRRDREPAAPSKAGMGVGMIMLIICGIGCCCASPVLLALIVPAVQKVREAAARTESMNNVKNIALGFHGYADTHRTLPFNGTQVANPQVPGSGSWAYQILPFVEQQGLFMQVNRNAAVKTYMCPGRPRPPIEAGGGAWTDYFLNNYINDADNASQPNTPDKKRGFANIPDGTSNTVLIGHGNINTAQYPSMANVTLSTNIFDGGKAGTMRAGNNGVQAPGGWSLRQDSPSNPTVGSWGGPFPSGAIMCMGDASARTFNYNIANFGVFLTPSGGEAVMLP